MSVGRSPSPEAARDMDVDMENGTSDAKVVVITNLTRNVVEAHLQTIFGFYGTITKLDLPTFQKSGQNRGKAALEYAEASSARQAVSHMDGGQLDGAIVKVELSDLPVRPRSHSLTRSRSPPPRRSRARSYSRSRSRSRSPKYSGRRPYGRPDRDDHYRRPYGRRPPPRAPYRPISRSRSRSPIRRIGGVAPRRRSPSYERGGYGRGRSRSRSPSYSVRSSRSRTRSLTPRSRSRSYSSDSRYSRSRTRSVSYSRGRRSPSHDDIRDSRSRSPPPTRDA